MKRTDFFTKEDATREWYVVEAQDQVLGRLATRVASGLRGKHQVAVTHNAGIGAFAIVINADKGTLGAWVWRGKHKVAFAHNADIGDFVIVINADKVKLTGRKMTDKSYYRHTGYIGGLKETTPGKVLASTHPERGVEGGGRGMLPRTGRG